MRLSLVPTFFALLCCSSFGQTFVKDDFSDTSDLSLNGDAKVWNSPRFGPALRIADTETYQIGSVFTSDLLPIGSFSTSFVFRLARSEGLSSSDCEGETGGDGIAFVIHASPATSIGGLGVGIGYEGIPDAVAVEFDTWCNQRTEPRNDPSSNHIGITVGGSANHGPGSPFTVDIPESLDNDLLKEAWIDYDGSVLSVYLGENGVRPPIPTLQRTLDLASAIGSNVARMGFTSGTGRDWNAAEVLRWEVRPLGGILHLSEPAPGVAGALNRAMLTSGTPGSMVTVAAGLVPGGTPVAGCTGIDFDFINASLVATATVDANGEAVLARHIPLALSGHLLFLQVVETSTCRVSNCVRWQL